MLAEVDHAQWVLVIPKMLRPYFPHHRELFGGFARAALTGISGFVDPHGRVTESLGIDEQDFLVADLGPSTDLAPRTRWGDWWAVLCAIAAAVLLVAGRKCRSAAVGP